MSVESIRAALLAGWLNDPGGRITIPPGVKPLDENGQLDNLAYSIAVEIWDNVGGGGVTDHALLDAGSLVWTAGGHTGPPDTFPAFDGSGDATTYDISDFATVAYVDGAFSVIGHNHDATYAPIAKGVTNGDAHDHNGGDGAQIAHANLSGIGTNTHAQIDTAVAASASHIANTSNPHAVTKTQVGLGNVTDDAQLKRAAGDFATFADKAVPIGADLVLIEDSAAAGAKKKVSISALPFDAAGAAAAAIVTAEAYTDGEIATLTGYIDAQDAAVFAAASAYTDAAVGAILPIDLTSEVTGDLPFANVAQLTGFSFAAKVGNLTGDMASFALTADTVPGRVGSGDITAVAWTAAGRTLLAAADAAAQRAALGLAYSSAVVIGRPAAELGVVVNQGTEWALLPGAADGQVLRWTGGAFAFGAVNLADADAVTGVLPVANFTTGTPDGTKFVRDDGVLAVPSGGTGLTHPDVMRRIAFGGF